MEIDEHYCDVILQRWANYTGKDPVREDGASFKELTEKAKSK
jgi:DNA modification methylase